ncbi:cysteine synthase family protein [bacterium]|nr:cysteine synthase family protein [bacterium]
MKDRTKRSPARGRGPGADFFGLIGRTPLIALGKFSPPGSKVRILAKAEWQNPGGSVKDRAAARMILEGERTGKLTPDKTILDATSGNTGIAYACIAAARGYRLKLCVPANISPERKHILAALGAEVIYTSALEGSDGAIRGAAKIFDQDPGRYFFPNQYGNDNNWRAHYHATGPEIWKDTRGKITHFIATVGTGGTLMGVGRFLKEKNRKIRVIAVEPDSPFHGLEGMKHMASSIVPKIYDRSFPDETLFVSTEAAHEAVRRAARQEGFLIGLSSGAALAAAETLARRVDSEKKPALIVTVFPDGADKYLTERFWKED